MAFPKHVIEEWNSSLISKILFGPISDSNDNFARILDISLYDGFKEHHGTAHIVAREDDAVILYSAYLSYLDDDERPSIWYFSGEYQEFSRVISDFERFALAPKIH